jgi:hypothetical protein
MFDEDGGVGVEDGGAEIGVDGLGVVVFSHGVE